MKNELPKKRIPKTSALATEKIIYRHEGINIVIGFVAAKRLDIYARLLSF